MYILISSTEQQTIKFSAGTAFRLQSAPLAYKMNSNVIMHFLLYGKGSSYNIMSNYTNSLKFINKYTTNLSDSFNSFTNNSNIANGVYSFVLDDSTTQTIQLNLASTK